jgi:hypothetical protein
VADIGVLRRDDVPAAVDLAQHASAAGLALLLAQCTRRSIRAPRLRVARRVLTRDSGVEGYKLRIKWRDRT